MSFIASWVMFGNLTKFSLPAPSYVTILVYPAPLNIRTKAATDVGQNIMEGESETYLQPLSHESSSNHDGTRPSRLDFMRTENGILKRAFSNKLAVRNSRKIPHHAIPEFAS